jgi:hypothetical protein
MTDEQKVQAFDWMAQRLRFAYTDPAEKRARMTFVDDVETEGRADPDMIEGALREIGFVPN